MAIFETSGLATGELIEKGINKVHTSETPQEPDFFRTRARARRQAPGGPRTATAEGFPTLSAARRRSLPPWAPSRRCQIASVQEGAGLPGAVEPIIAAPK